MTRQIISTPAAPSSPLYSQGVRVGAQIFVSGMVGIDASTGELAGLTIQQQTAQALANCEHICRVIPGPPRRPSRHLTVATIGRSGSGFASRPTDRTSRITRVSAAGQQPGVSTDMCVEHVRHRHGCRRGGRAGYG